MYLVASVCPSVRLSVSALTAVDIRGSALPSAAKSKEESIISPRCLYVCRIVARVRSIGF